MVFGTLHNNLCDTYKETRYTLKGVEWPPHQPKSIVSVALIHYKGKRTRQELFIIAQRHKDGSIGIDQLLSSSSQAPAAKRQCLLNCSRVTKDIADIFIADPMDQAESTAESSKPPKRILIEGAPGIGKTMLVKEIAYRWANKEILQNVELLLLIYLRDPRLRDIKEIKELLQLFTSPKIAGNVADYLQECNGNRVAFVIDGFDEYPTFLQKGSFIVDIIKGEILHKAIIVVTSRPTATIFLHDQVDRRIDILGFAKEEREKYITQSLGNCLEQKIKLFKYLKRQPTINAFCYIPLHIAVLLYLFQQGGRLPETLTEMNESFIIHTIYRYLTRHGLFSLCVIRKLSELPPPIFRVVHKLSQLAFKGLQENQLVFSLNEIKEMYPDINDTPGAINGFGLLQAVQCYPLEGAGVTTSLNFLHYTMQEYLAAFYVSTLSDKEQMSLMEKTFWNERFNFTWMMYVGIVGTKSKLFIDFICKGNVYKKKSGLKVSDEIQRDKRKRLHVFQCYTEANSKTGVPEIIASMFKDGIVKITDITLLPNHISSLVSFLSHSLIHLKVIKIKKCNFGDIGMNILEQYIADNTEETSTLEYIDLMGNNSSPWNLYCTVIKQCSVSSLTLCGDHRMEEFTCSIEDSLLTNTTLHSLTLSEIGITGLNIIKTIVFYNKSSFHLKELNLSWRNISIKATDNLNVLLQLKFLVNNERIVGSIGRVISVNVLSTFDGSNSLAIESLNLSGQCEGNGVFFIAFCLCYNESICMLNISNNSISDLGAEEIAKALHQNKTLQKLDISNNKIHVDGAKAIAQALLENRTLLTLDISNNNICFNGTKHISDCIKKNLILLELIISNNSLFAEGAKLIAEAIQVNKILQKLDISSNKISDKGATFISDCLKHNKSLQELNLSKNEITNKGLETLSEAILINLALVKLDLSKNFITTKGIVDFLKIVSNKSVLRFLNFAYNNVTKCGLRRLTQCIKVFKMYISCNVIADKNADILKSTVSCLSYDRLVDTTTCSIIEVNVWPLSSISNVEHRAAFLSECLKENDTLQSFKLHDKSIINYQSSFILIAEAIQISTTMQKLDLSNNSISDDGAAVISNSLKMNTSLQELKLKHNKITDKGTHLIFEAIKMTSTLQKFDMHANKISDYGAAAISDSLKVNRSLQELDIGDNNITDEGVKLIFEAIKVNTTIQKLLLYSSKISDNGAVPISDSLKVNASLQELNIGYNGITDKGAKLVFEAIQVNTTIQKLVFYHNQLSDDGAAAISDSLKVNRSLRELDLGSNSITDKGVKLIFRAIQWNTTLYKLMLNDNEISYDGAAAIGDSLKFNRSLQEIDIGGNSIIDKDAILIFIGIHVNTIIKKLVLSDSKISDDGAAAISNSLTMNRSLQELCLGYSNITNKGARLIFEAIHVNTKIQKLVLNDNRISDDGAAAIGDSLKTNKTLQELDLGYNRITGKGAILIFKAIQENITLKKLILYGNRISDGGAAAISDGLKVNKSLQELNIGYNSITDKGAKVVFEAIQINTVIQKLLLHHNQISDDGAAVISDSLKLNRSLLELNIGINSITDKGAKLILEAIQVNTTVQRILLSNDKISDNQISAINDSLKINRSLQKLGIKHSRITDKLILSEY